MRQEKSLNPSLESSALNTRQAYLFLKPLTSVHSHQLPSAMKEAGVLWAPASSTAHPAHQMKQEWVLWKK